MAQFFALIVSRIGALVATSVGISMADSPFLFYADILAAAVLISGTLYIVIDEAFSFKSDNDEETQITEKQEEVSSNNSPEQNPKRPPIGPFVSLTAKELIETFAQLLEDRYYFTPNEYGYYGNSGSSSYVRRIPGGQERAIRFFNQNTVNHVEQAEIKDKDGQVKGYIRKMSDGTQYVYRSVSSSDGTSVVEIFNSPTVKNQKIHFID